MNLKFTATVQRQKIDNVLLSLKWVTSLPYARRVFALEKVKARVLAYLQSIYPKASSESRVRRRYLQHLVTGWQTKDIPGMSDKVGFILSHRQVNNPMVKKILASLELGSRGYYNKLEGHRLGDYALATFAPGDHRGNRHSTGPADFAQVKRLHIPARPGGKHISKTYAFARQMVLGAKPEYFQKIVQSFNRGEKQ